MRTNPLFSRYMVTMGGGYDHDVPTVVRDDCSKGEQTLELEGSRERGGERERDGFHRIPETAWAWNCRVKWGSDKVGSQRVTMMKQMHREIQLSLQHSTA